jgi:hypothetical protein
MWRLLQDLIVKFYGKNPDIIIKMGIGKLVLRM